MVKDANLAAMVDADKARIVRGSTEDWIIDKEEEIINRLLRHYRADTLTDHMARGSIGEIAGIRTFREYLETTIRRGVVASNVELKQDG